jgi:O-antigen ligase
MKSATWEIATGREKFRASPLFAILGAGCALLAGLVMGRFGTHTLEALVCALLLAIPVVLRRDELVAAAVIPVSLYFDFYLGGYVLAVIMAVGLLCVFYLARSPERPWVTPRGLWLWALYLGLAIYPAIAGALTPQDTLTQYPDLVLGALAAFWLGNVVSRGPESIRLLFQFLAGFGVLIALHTIIQRATGTTLLASSSASSFLANVNYYQLSTTSSISRLGSFFIDPDFAGIFFAAIIFVPLGLFAASTSRLGRLLYLLEAVTILPALLFTYSTSSWLAVGVGMLILLILVGGVGARIRLLAPIAAGAVFMFAGFSSQLSLLIQHSSNPEETALREALWQSGLRAIEAHPFTGVGLGHLAYQLRADALYHMPPQIRPYDHPHNSYVQLGAMAGLPVLAVFAALVAFALVQALQNRSRADDRTRPLVAAGIAGIVAVSFNSWSNEGWTLPPLAALSWLMLGIVASPLLGRVLAQRACHQSKVGPDL